LPFTRKKKTKEKKKKTNKKTKKQKKKKKKKKKNNPCTNASSAAIKTKSPLPLRPAQVSPWPPYLHRFVAAGTWSASS